MISQTALERSWSSRYRGLNQKKREKECLTVEIASFSKS